MASQLLVTGATGFIGRHLTRDLVSQGHAVRILARNEPKARSLFGDSVEILTGDLRDSSLLKEACTGAETVYHIGGIYRFGLRHRREIFETNISGTESLFQAASDAAVNKFVHVSSASVLQRPEAITNPWAVLDETAFPSTPPKFSPYRYSKWEAENRALAWSKRGLPVVITNITCPIGPEDEAPTPTGQIIHDFIRGGFPCYSATGLNFVNVSDVVSGLQLAAKSGRTGERYLLSHQNLWLKEFLDRLSEQTGVAAPRVCLPHGLILALSCFGEAIDFLTPGSQSARLCLETALKAQSVQFFSNAKARQELGWAPVSIQAGIQQALDWYQNEPTFNATCAPLPVTKSHVR